MGEAILIVLAWGLLIFFLARMLLALVILHAILSNPERYKYIGDLAKKKDAEGNPKYSNRELTQKNIHKAFMMADQFMEIKSWWPFGKL